MVVRESLIWAGLAFVCTACTPESDDRVASAATSSPNVFDPAAAQRGDSVAGLVLEELRREGTPDGEWVGSARFSGAVSLGGHTFAHPDGADYPFPCFEVDSVAARRLPRWKGDERRPWFCFENSTEARALFGGTAAGRPFSIRIDRFTIHRNLTDAVNSARLLRLGPGDSLSRRDSVECYRTSESVLARQPGSVADGPAGLTGLIVLYGRVSADTGAARLADSDARSLGAQWRRVSPDTIAMTASDDFLRVEMRLAVSDSLATGLARAHSDAALERDSAGKEREFRREWGLRARRASCG